MSDAGKVTKHICFFSLHYESQLNILFTMEQTGSDKNRFIEHIFTSSYMIYLIYD